MTVIQYLIYLDIYTTTKFYEVFSGKQPCQNIKMFRRFEDQLRPHRQLPEDGDGVHYTKMAQHMKLVRTEETHEK